MFTSDIYVQRYSCDQQPQSHYCAASQNNEATINQTSVNIFTGKSYDCVTVTVRGI